MAEYYVNYTTGLDTNDGSIGLPFKNIPTTGNGTGNVPATLLPGDNVYLACGETWPEQKRINATSAGGSKGSPIVFQSYGAGVRPVLDQRKTITSWSAYDSVTWSVSGIDNDAITPRVFFNNVGQSRQAADEDSVDADNPFYHDNATDILYVWSGSNTLNPTDVHGIVQCTLSNGTQTSFGVLLGGTPYMEFRGIEIRGSHSVGFYINNSQLSRTCIEIKVIGCAVQYSRIGVFFDNGPDAANDPSAGCVVRGNYINANWSALENDSSANNGGDGVVTTKSVDGLEISGNTITDFGHSCINIGGTAANPVTNVQIFDNVLTAPTSNYCRGVSCNGVSGAVSKVKIYKNLIYDTTVRNQIEGVDIEFVGNVIDTMRQAGYDPGSSVEDALSTNARNTAEAENILIANNYIINVFSHGITSSSASGYEVINYKCFNNTVINNTGESNLCLRYIDNGNGNDSTFTNNNIMSSQTTDLIEIDGTDYTIAEAEVESSDITGTISSDPEPNADYSLNSDSVAINAGIELPSSHVGYSGEPFPNWDVDLWVSQSLFSPFHPVNL